MLIEEVKKCSFSQWYPIFGHLSIESEIIKIDDKFIEYILSDGIMLPECCNSETQTSPQNGHHNGNNHDGNEDEDQPNIDWNNEEGHENDDDEIAIVEFPYIEKRIRRCLKRFDSVFPKLNWSSCEDSSWIHATGTKCTDLTSVFLLLKSSDKIVHDLTEPFENCSDYDANNPPEPVEYELILRKWINMNPSMEFRCFIRDNHLIGICQRDVRTYYEYVKKEKTEIIEDIRKFFDENIANKFHLSNFVIDILRPKTGFIQLIDVNVFGPLTDSLLFDWNELERFNFDPDEDFLECFRFIEDHSMGIQRTRFETNSLPLDVFNGNIANIYDDFSMSSMPSGNDYDDDDSNSISNDE